MRERDVHVRLSIQSEEAAQQFEVLAYSYTSASETPVIKFTRVLRSDSSTVDPPIADANDMSTQVTREAPLYSDLKEKHLPIRSLLQRRKRSCARMAGPAMARNSLFGLYDYSRFRTLSPALASDLRPARRWSSSGSS